MRNITNILFIVIACASFCMQSFAQTEKDYLRFGDKAFELKNYASAAHFYGKILGESSTQDRTAVPYTPSKCSKPPKIDPNATDYVKSERDEFESSLLSPEYFEYVIYRLAESYRLSFNYENAEDWYERSIEFDRKQFPLAKFWYGMMLKSNGKYDKSLDQFAAFIKQYSESQSFYTIKAELEIAGSLFALDELAKKPKDKVLKLDAGVNTTGSEYAAVFLPSDTNTIIYTSAVSVALAEENRNMAKRPYKSNILTTTQGELGWSRPKGLGIAINSSAYEGAPSITANGKRIYFTRWNEDHKKPEWSIYVSNKSGEFWQPPQKLNEKVNMPGFRALHPSVSPDGGLLFFSSNRPGGYGKIDIWLSILDENGEPGEVINLGERVNTIEDELSPFFNNTTKTLYYSSNGKIGMGGFDIYKTFSGAGSWSDPENLGYPINSSKDDMFFVTTDHESYGYLSSDREGSCECITGYCYNLYSVLSKPLIITLSGTVYKQSTKKVIRNCLIIVEDNIGNNTAFITDDNGRYETELQEDITYYFKTKKTTFFSAEAAINTSGIEESIDLIQDFYLERIPIGEIEIPGILYDFNSASLRSESKLILDELVNFLNLNDNIVIEVASHTDERGNDYYNYKLSKSRAKSVIDYLIAKEIEIPRLKSVGFGEKKLLVKHANSEEDHQKNRRTTFKILSEDYISPSAL